MAAFRRIPAVVLAMAFVLVPTLVATGAAASTQDDLDAARSKLAEAKAAATAAATAYADAESKQAETQNRIDQLRDTIETQKNRAAALKDIATQRALYAYTHKDAKLDLLVGTGDAVTAIRQTQWIDRANETDHDAIRRLAAINVDLKEQQTQLEQVEKQQAQIVTSLDARNRDLQARLADQQSATNALQTKLDQEIAAANAARAAQLAAEKAALAASKPVASAGSGGGGGGGGAGQILNAPVVNGFRCPVSGAAYSDDFGGPRQHGGIDMFVPTGTPVVAVKSGSVSYMPFEGAGGNTAYLNASDGNTYFYAHLSSFAGGARSVSQGEVIGYSGMTGNASAPHLHFEIRVGGPNGGKINPYPTLRGAGC
jgi:murein DD-endopeptidase MepM/ murein hydrolase activator NlpD